MIDSVYPLSSGLIDRNPDDFIALNRAPLAALGGQEGYWRCSDFLGQVMRLAAVLPERQYAINLCENRYLFMLGFCAAIVKRQTNLLPQNRAEATQRNLLDQYSNSYILHDGVASAVHDARHFDINYVNLLGEPTQEIPHIPSDFLAAIAFTSGSTGQPKANVKLWRTLVDSSKINARFMLPADYRQYQALATVPAQHMWGLETSVLLPLFAPLCVADSRPLFPQDIFNALTALSEPRVLISTPVHLRALALSGLTMPKVERILCATAPLSATLASDVETLFDGKLAEVFGCSEVGSMATRFTSHEDQWQLFDGLNISTQENISGFTVNADHLPASVELTDSVEWLDERVFRLLGRGDDMIEIAGKRGSIQEMNKILMLVPGVRDGVVFLPETSSEKVNRPVALVVADNVSKETLTAHFTKYLDPVFIPRPLHFVASLPREENGKLVRSNLLAFFEKIKV